MCEPGEAFVNYSSIEDSEYGQEVLDDLVAKGFVMRYNTVEEAIEALGGTSPTLSKIALTATMPYGVLRHRLILDCRVSGVNDHSHKIERALLPSAWTPFMIPWPCGPR